MPALGQELRFVLETFPATSGVVFGSSHQPVSLMEVEGEDGAAAIWREVWVEEADR